MDSAQAATRIQRQVRGQRSQRHLASVDVDVEECGMNFEDSGTRQQLTKQRTQTFLILDDKDDVAIGHISELPKILVTVMSNHRTRIQDLFATLDENHDGQIEPHEFRNVLTGIGFTAPNETDLDKLFRAIDAPPEGHVSFEKLEAFCRAVKRGKQVMTPESEADRRKRLGLDDKERLERERAAAEAERVRRELEEARAHEAALEAARRERERAEREMSAWLRASKEEQEKRYQAMLAAARALLPPPHGSNTMLTTCGDGNPAEHSPPWNGHHRPRVERAGSRPIAFNATPDTRHGSVAFPRPRELSAAAVLSPARRPALSSSRSAPMLMPPTREPVTLVIERAASTGRTLPERAAPMPITPPPPAHRAPPTLAPSEPSSPPSLTTAITASATLIRPQSTKSLQSAKSSRSLRSPGSAGTSGLSPPSTHAPPHRPLVADGSRRVLLTVTRIAPNHFTFIRAEPFAASGAPRFVGLHWPEGNHAASERSATKEGTSFGGRAMATVRITPPRGLICDTDTVAAAACKLAAAYPTELPSHVPFSRSDSHGAPAVQTWSADSTPVGGLQRSVKLVLMSGGKILAGEQYLADQVREAGMQKYNLVRQPANAVATGQLRRMRSAPVLAGGGHAAGMRSSMR